MPSTQRLGRRRGRKKSLQTITTRGSWIRFSIFQGIAKGGRAKRSERWAKLGECSVLRLGAAIPMRNERLSGDAYSKSP